MTDMKQSFFPGDLLFRSLIAAVVIGAAAALIGAFSIGESFMDSRISGGGVLDPWHNCTGNALLLLLVVGKVIIDLSFSVTGLLLIVLMEKVNWVAVVSPAAGLALLVLIICHISFFWDPGWSQIPEPAGYFSMPLAQIVLSFIQSFAFIIGGVRR